MSVDHSHAPAEFNRAFSVAIALNIGFVAVEASYGWKAGCMPPMVESISR